MEESKKGDTASKEQNDIKKEMAGGFNDLAKHEVMIKRMEEVKRDSIKIKLLEDALKELKEIKLELKVITTRNNNIDEAMKKQHELLREARPA